MTTLLEAARDAKARAYAPYSGYQVGAALRTEDGTVYTGGNIEVVNYSNTIHAEEVALMKAVDAGDRSFDAIAISTHSLSGDPPCGMCLQTLTEFCPPELLILSETESGHEEMELRDCLPAGMPPSELQN
jgi:cytidine deaminase